MNLSGTNENCFCFMHAVHFYKMIIGCQIFLKRKCSGTKNMKEYREQWRFVFVLRYSLLSKIIEVLFNYFVVCKQYLIIALVLLKKNMFTNALIAKHACMITKPKTFTCIDVFFLHRFNAPQHLKQVMGRKMRPTKQKELKNLR